MSRLQPNTTEESNGDLVLLRRYFKDGDRDAMEELFNRHAGAAYRLALANVDNPADAEEIVQTAFLQVLLNGDKEIFKVRGWIMGTVVHACRKKVNDESRRRERQEVVALNRDAATKPDDERAEMSVAAVNAVKALPKRFRLPVLLHYLEGLTYDEVGCALSLPEATVRKQASLGIEQIRQSLRATGFTACMVTVPELLASSALSEAPVALTASIKALVASAAAKGSGVATGAAPATAKGAVAATLTNVTITAALLLVVMAATSTAFHARDGGRNEPKEDAQTPEAAYSPTPKDTFPLRAIDKSFAEILNKKIDVNYRREYLSEVLNDLNLHAGLRSAYPNLIDRTFMFTLEEKQISVRQVLENIAAIGKLELEYHADEVVFWKKADEKILAALEKKFNEGDVQARCKAVYDLAGLGDKRIFPLLFRALKDVDEAVVTKTVIEIGAQHSKSLFYGDNVSAAVDPLLKLLATPQFAGCRSEVIWELGQTRDPRAVKALIGLLQDVDADVRYSAAKALGETRDPRAVEPLIALFKDANATVRYCAAEAVGKTWDSRAVESLIALMQDADAAVQHNAARVLGVARDPRAIKALIALSKDADAGVRYNAAQALAAVQNPRAVEPLGPDSNHLSLALHSLNAFWRLCSISAYISTILQVYWGPVSRWAQMAGDDSGGAAGAPAAPELEVNRASCCGLRWLCIVAVRTRFIVFLPVILPSTLAPNSVSKTARVSVVRNRQTTA